MSLIDVARDTLKEIPMAAILRERLSLALDQSAGFERQVAALQTELGKLQAQLEFVTLDRDKAREELQRLKDAHAEEVVIHSAIEFRRGKRTRGQRAAFCPKCHMPVTAPMGFKAGCTANCGWACDVTEHELAYILTQL
ncbi:MAG: hypothetical protein KA236_00005 [Verrucomicrobia bacterium]|jgi:hypothetical protein|nr:hypothetical protein [Verrucomicrobiota bacterium]